MLEMDIRPQIDAMKDHDNWCLRTETDFILCSCVKQEVLPQQRPSVLARLTDDESHHRPKNIYHAYHLAKTPLCGACLPPLIVPLARPAHLPNFIRATKHGRKRLLNPIQSYDLPVLSVVENRVREL